MRLQVGDGHPVRGVAESRAETLLAFTEGGFRFFLLGDVAKVGQVPSRLLPLGRELNHANRDPDDPAVLAAIALLVADHSRLGGLQVRHELAGQVQILLHCQVEGRHVKEFFLRIADEIAKGLVSPEESRVGISEDNPIRRVVVERAEEGFAGVQRGSRPALLRDVAEVREHKVAARPEKGGERNVGDEVLSAKAPVDPVEAAASHFVSFANLLGRLLRGGSAIRLGRGRKVLGAPASDIRGAGQSEGAGGGFVASSETPLLIHQEDRIAVPLEHEAEAFLTAAQAAEGISVFAR